MHLGKIIVAIAILIGLILFQKTKPKILKLFLAVFILNFLSSFFYGDLFFYFSFLSFGIVVLGYFIYCLYTKNWIPSLISLFALVSFIFKAQHWPYETEIRTAMVIPIILFLTTLYNFKKYKNQISIITFIVAYEISEIIRLLNYIITANS